ncbi:GNAT family N-acetyltransferase [soil metagenome]
MSSIRYHTELRITPQQLAEVFDRSGINRPSTDLARMEQMLAHADLLVTAWDGEELIAVARALTDFCYCCYLSDLAVDRAYQQHGIGRKLLQTVQDKIGAQTALLLLAAPSAMAYYPKVGFTAADNAWIIQRTW